MAPAHLDGFNPRIRKFRTPEPISPLLARKPGQKRSPILGNGRLDPLHPDNWQGPLPHQGALPMNFLGEAKIGPLGGYWNAFWTRYWDKVVRIEPHEDYEPALTHRMTPQEASDLLDNLNEYGRCYPLYWVGPYTGRYRTPIWTVKMRSEVDFDEDPRPEDQKQDWRVLNGRPVVWRTDSFNISASRVMAGFTGMPFDAGKDRMHHADWCQVIPQPSNGYARCVSPTCNFPTQIVVGRSQRIDHLCYAEPLISRDPESGGTWRNVETWSEGNKADDSYRICEEVFHSRVPLYRLLAGAVEEIEVARKLYLRGAVDYPGKEEEPAKEPFRGVQIPDAERLWHLAEPEFYLTPEWEAWEAALDDDGRAEIDARYERKQAAREAQEAEARNQLRDQLFGLMKPVN